MCLYFYYPHSLYAMSVLCAVETLVFRNERDFIASESSPTDHERHLPEPARASTRAWSLSVSQGLGLLRSLSVNPKCLSSKCLSGARASHHLRCAFSQRGACLGLPTSAFSIMSLVVSKCLSGARACLGAFSITTRRGTRGFIHLACRQGAD